MDAFRIFVIVTFIGGYQGYTNAQLQSKLSAATKHNKFKIEKNSIVAHVRDSFTIAETDDPRYSEDIRNFVMAVHN